MSKVQQFCENEDKLAYVSINGLVYVESEETFCKSLFCKKAINAGRRIQITSDISIENIHIALDAMRGDFKSVASHTSIVDHVTIIKFLRFLEVSDDFLVEYASNISNTLIDFVLQCAQLPHYNELLFIFENAQLSVVNHKDHHREVPAKPTISVDLHRAILGRIDVCEKNTFDSDLCRTILGRINIREKNTIKENVAIVGKTDISIPSGTTKVVFRYDFDESIEDRYIPDTVLEIIFGEYFNQSIFECIPNSVIRLIFGRRFNQSIFECIPDSVEYLEFGDDFNQSIVNCIPPSVKHIVFGKNFRHPLRLQFPSIEKITLHRDYNLMIDNNLIAKIVLID